MQSPAMIEGWLKQRGLAVLALTAATDTDQLPRLDSGSAVSTLLLIGHGGSTLWPSFSHSGEYADGLPDPLDRWSERLGRELAALTGGCALFPFAGPPFWPFLRWSHRAGVADASPLGLSLHRRFGFWYAYRFAIGLPAEWSVAAFSGDTLAGETTGSAVDGINRLDTDHCSTCVAQPCLGACPVEAFTGSEYHHRRCAGFLADNPDHGCNHHGCAARRACPVGQAFVYDTPHARYHMGVFVDLHGRS